MTTEAIVVTMVASLVSGLLGVLVSAWFYYRMERHKQKLDLARRLLGNRYSIKGDAFSCAMNEVIAVFADSPKVLEGMKALYAALESPGKSAAESVLIDFLKAVTMASGLTQSNLNETYLLKTFNARD